MEVAEGTTIEQFFQQQVPDGKPGDFLIRVNRQVAAKDEVLQPGARVTVTPLKIVGAV